MCYWKDKRHPYSLNHLSFFFYWRSWTHMNHVHYRTMDLYNGPWTIWTMDTMDHEHYGLGILWTMDLKNYGLLTLWTTQTMNSGHHGPWTLNTMDHEHCGIDLRHYGPWTQQILNTWTVEIWTTFLFYFKF